MTPSAKRTILWVTLLLMLVLLLRLTAEDEPRPMRPTERGFMG